MQSHKLISLSVLVTIFVLTNHLHAQSPEIQKSLERALGTSSQARMNQSLQEEREVVNIDNSVKQYDELDRLVEEQKYLERQIEARKELATKLCFLDDKACYLIDNYSKFKSQESSELLLDDLELFGKDLFTGYPLNFDVVDNTPVPDFYILGYGDVLTVNVLGPKPSLDFYPIGRDGTLNLPEFGSIYIQNLTFKEAQEKISNFISSKGIGADVQISIKKLKNITVNVGGSTRYPGTYKISSQSSALNVIAAVGGLVGNPSLRNVKITSADGSVVYEDLYDSLIFGTASGTTYLKSGDIINIPPAENFVYLLGNVNRQAIYEFKEGETTSDLVKMGLGFKPNTDDFMVVKRLNELGSYVSLMATSSNPVKLKKGDILEVNQYENRFVDGIEIYGAIRRPGKYQLSNDAKLSSIISLENDLIESTYLPIFVVQRFNPLSNNWKYKFYNLMNRNEFNEINILPKDRIFFLSKNDINFLNSFQLANFLKSASQNYFQARNSVYDNFNSEPASMDSKEENSNTISSLKIINERITNLESEVAISSSQQKTSNDVICFDNLSATLTQNFLKEIYQKTSSFLPKNNSSCTDLFSKHSFLLAAVLQNTKVVFGDVDSPGIYPVGGKVFINGIFDYVHASGDYEDFNLSINNVITNQKNAIIDSSNLSFLTFNKVNQDQLSRFVHLSGEFVNPGTYPIFDGDTVTDIYERAGGFKETAFPSGAIFTREYLKQEEENTLKLFRNNLSDILTNAISNGYLQQNPTDLMVLMDVMAQANSVAVSGRLVTDLRPSIKNSSKDLTLLDGDMIFMPRKTNTINVSGQVLNPTSLVYSPDSKPYDYINSAGGLKDGADKSSIYVINPNGETFNLRASRSLGFKAKHSIMPGATIIVPRKARNLDGLGLVERIAPTIASLSVTAASIAAIQD
ncbi:MAG: hypothetical protein CBC64_005360 [Gammaproteobacteria bacterium TMED104]|nr:MAG: hypothetical protein CBC64_005360 [Gammaproteobacteria bacterium TMED104]|tara:strand:+ start:1630 stop:4380 length:2751 start_codon:yes stop_codon:yes gene_type:complete